MSKNKPSMMFRGHKVGRKTNNSCIGHHFLSNENEFPAPGVHSCWLLVESSGGGCAAVGSVNGVPSAGLNTNIDIIDSEPLISVHLG